LYCSLFETDDFRSHRRLEIILYRIEAVIQIYRECDLLLQETFVVTVYSGVSPIFHLAIIIIIIIILLF